MFTLLLTLKSSFVHLGIRIKHLIETKSNLNKVDFANEIGHTSQSLHGMFKKEDLNTSLLKTIAKVLDISLSEIFTDSKQTSKQKIYSNASNLEMIAEEGEVYGVVNYKEKYLETLEKLNACNERLVAYSDIKKDSTKKH